MNICDKCTHIDSLKEWICSFALKGTCNICNSANQSIVTWSDFLRHIKKLISQVYTENSKGNVVIRDVIESMKFQAHPEIKTMLIRELQNTYSRRIDADVNSNPSSIFPLIVLWKDFKLILKYKCRFFCKEYIMDNYHKPEKAEMFFNKFKSLINEFREECLISTLDKNNLLYRARDNSNGKIEIMNSQTLGAPGPKDKIYPTRTSPVGISVFYSSMDKSTAIKEIKTKSEEFTVGQWRLNQKCFFIDISKYDNNYTLPDYWSFKNFRKRDLIQFLSVLNNEFSKKIEKDKKNHIEHIEYLSTQLISEFFKINYADVCGIIYKSSVSNNKNVAIFNERFQCLDLKQYNGIKNKDVKTLILEKHYS